MVYSVSSNQYKLYLPMASCRRALRLNPVIQSIKVNDCVHKSSLLISVFNIIFCYDSYSNGVIFMFRVSLPIPVLGAITF